MNHNQLLQEDEPPCPPPLVGTLVTSVKFSVEFKTSRASLSAFCLSFLDISATCIPFHSLSLLLPQLVSSLCTSSHLSFNSISPPLTFTLFCCFPIFSFCTMKLKCVLKHFAHLLALCFCFLCTILSS